MKYIIELTEEEIKMVINAVDERGDKFVSTNHDKAEKYYDLAENLIVEYFKQKNGK